MGPTGFTRGAPEKMKRVYFGFAILALMNLAAFSQEVTFDKTISLGMNKNQVLGTLGLPIWYIQRTSSFEWVFLWFDSS